MTPAAALRGAGRLLGAAAIAAGAAGCGSLLGGDVPAPTYYLWRDTGAATPAPQASPLRLILAPTEAAAFYDTQRIAFSRSPGTRDRYELAWWTDRPGKRFDVLLAERLEKRNAFAAVAAMTSGTRGDLMLSAVVLDLHHDAQKPPGSAYLAVAAELVDLRSRALLARRSFVAQVSVPDENPAAAVAAFDAAVTRLLDELLPWLEGEAAKASPR
jgi:cholesterol transport system auxiliary component